MYLCNPINHHAQTPIAKPVIKLPSMLPTTAAIRLPPDKITVTPAPALITSTHVSDKWPDHEMCRRYRRKTGKSPKTSILKSVMEKT